MYNFDPYVTADVDLTEAQIDWSEFDPAVGSGAFMTNANELDVDGNPEGYLPQFYSFDPYVS